MVLLVNFLSGAPLPSWDCFRDYHVLNTMTQAIISACDTNGDTATDNDGDNHSDDDNNISPSSQ